MARNLIFFFVHSLKLCKKCPKRLVNKFKYVTFRIAQDKGVIFMPQNWKVYLKNVHEIQIWQQNSQIVPNFLYHMTKEIMLKYGTFWILQDDVVNLIAQDRKILQRIVRNLIFKTKPSKSAKNSLNAWVKF